MLFCKVETEIETANVAEIYKEIGLCTSIRRHSTGGTSSIIRGHQLKSYDEGEVDESNSLSVSPPSISEAILFFAIF